TALSRRFVTAMITVIVMMGFYAAAQNVSESELRYREALRKQQVDGDLPAAIKLYQDIVASKTADHATKARALLQLAICYETQGKQAQAVYEQIIKEYGDQPAAGEAKAKLAALRTPAAPPSTRTLRKIEFGPGITGPVLATDGQHAVYADTETRTVY